MKNVIITNELRDKLLVLRPYIGYYQFTEIELEIVRELYRWESFESLEDLNMRIPIKLATLSYNCKKLLREGFLLMFRNPRNKHKKYIEITEKGRITYYLGYDEAYTSF